MASPGLSENFCFDLYTSNVIQVSRKSAQFGSKKLILLKNYQYAKFKAFSSQNFDLNRS